MKDAMKLTLKKETIRNNDSDNIMWDNTPCQKI